MTPIEQGKTYVDGLNSRRIVLSVEGGAVRFMRPIGGGVEECPLAVFEEWAVAEYQAPGA